MNIDRDPISRTVTDVSLQSATRAHPMSIGNMLQINAPNQPPKGPGGIGIITEQKSSIPVSRRTSHPEVLSNVGKTQKKGFSAPGGVDILNPITSAARLPIGPGGISIVTGAGGGTTLGSPGSPRPFRGAGGISVLNTSPMLATISPTQRRGFVGAGRFDVLNPDSTMEDLPTMKKPSPKSKKPFRPWEHEAAPRIVTSPKASKPPKGAGGISLVEYPTTPKASGSKGKKPFRPWE